MAAPGFDLDSTRLTHYLEARVDGFAGPLTVEKFADGQSNPTYSIRAKSGCYVLRRKPPGNLLKSAHAVDREFRVMKALANSDVPVPRMVHLCTDDDVIGSMFFLMEHIDGRVLWHASLPDMSNVQRAAIYSEMNRVLAAINSVDVQAAGLADFGKPGNYFARQVARWSRQYKAAQTRPIDEMEQLMGWLAASMPADDGRVALVHGDYRLDNMLFHPDEARVLAVIDWELSTLGHPFADLAYQCMQMRLPHDGQLSGLAGLDRNALGIPEEAAYVESFCRRMGIAPIPNWNFYIVFNMFRLAAIIQGVMKRAIDGNASSEKALRMGSQVQPLAQLALSLCENS